MTEKIFLLVMCHIVGDYVLQTDFIAKTKGENWYHLVVHCLLYCVPFYFVFGWCWQLYVVFLAHVVVDSLKARWKVINYVTDQVLHYCTLAVYLLN